MQQEWEASQSCDALLVQLGRARARRCKLEALHDVACKLLMGMRAETWGALPVEA